MAARSRNRICLAQIGAPHGVQGHVRVKPFTEDLLGIADYGTLESEDGRRLLTVSKAREIKGGMLVVKFREIGTRDEAEALKGVKLFIDRSRLADLDDEDDFYVEDLIGLLVRDETGDSVGHVRQVHNFGAGDLIEIKPGRGQSVLVPFTKAAVPNVSPEAGLLVVSRKEAGLLDDDDQSEQQG